MRVVTPNLRHLGRDRVTCPDTGDTHQIQPGHEQPFALDQGASSQPETGNELMSNGRHGHWYYRNHFGMQGANVGFLDGHVAWRSDDEKKYRHRDFQNRIHW